MLLNSTNISSESNITLESALKASAQQLILICFFLLGIALYVIAVETTYYDTSIIVVLALAAGPAVLLLGYGTVVLIGGAASLGLAEFLARVTRSRHVIEMRTEEPQTLRKKIRAEYFLLLMPGLVFLLSLALIWDVHNLRDPRTSMFYPLLQWLDVLSRTGTSVTYAVEAIPAMIIFIAISGIVPAFVLPYLRKFKITGVNGGPFHVNLLNIVLGAVVSVGAALTLLGIAYEVLWVRNGPIYLFYGIPVMLGLSIQYTVGACMGREKAEEYITKTLEEQSRKRVVRGTIEIKGPHENGV